MLFISKLKNIVKTLKCNNLLQGIKILKYHFIISAPTEICCKKLIYLMYYVTHKNIKCFLCCISLRNYFYNYNSISKMILFDFQQPYSNYVCINLFAEHHFCRTNSS